MSFYALCRLARFGIRSFEIFDNLPSFNIGILFVVVVFSNVCNCILATSLDMPCKVNGVWAINGSR